MGDRSSIEWTEATWNPTTGCDTVSAGCDNCYALTLAKRLKAMGSAHYQTDGDPRTSGPGFGVAVHPDALDIPLRWRRPRRVFVNSMSDLFHPRVPDEFIARVFAVMAATPQHTYQILTKRPARMRSVLRDECRCGAGHAPGVHLRSAMEWAATSHSPTYVPGLRSGVYFGPWPLPNVWLGVSVEDQEQADRRIPPLLDTPAAVRWVSAEPLLGPADIEQWLHDPECLWMPKSACTCQPGGARLDWVVVGGESGPGARIMEPAWARLLRDQTRNATAAFFFKQWGAWAPNGARGIGRFEGRERLVGPTIDGMGHREVVERQTLKGFRVLDGRTWDQYPATSTTTVGASA